MLRTIFDRYAHITNQENFIDPFDILQNNNTKRNVAADAYGGSP